MLAQSKRVMAPSLPPWQGSMQSVQVEAYAAIVEELILQENISSKVTLAGNSLGGWIAMKLAQAHPEKIEALILEDTAGANHEESEMIRAVASSQIPVCIIWGKEDKVVPVEAARYLHSKLPRSSLVLLENVGHVPHWERPEEFNNTVLRFLGLSSSPERS